MAAAKGAQAGHWTAIGPASSTRDTSEISAASAFRTPKSGSSRAGMSAATAVILDALVKSVVAELWPKGLIQRGGGAKAAEVGATVGALVKAVLLDMDFAVSVYLEALDNRRKEAETSSVSASSNPQAQRSRRSARGSSNSRPNGSPTEFRPTCRKPLASCNRISTRRSTNCSRRCGA